MKHLKRVLRFEIYLKSAGSYDAANKDERDTIVCDENGFGPDERYCRMVFIPYTRLLVGKAER